MQTLYHTEDLLDRLDDINELFWMIHLLAYEEAIWDGKKRIKNYFSRHSWKKNIQELEHKVGVAKRWNICVSRVDDFNYFKAAAPPLIFTNLLTSVTNYKK
jgi:hypothetical protein